MKSLVVFDLDGTLALSKSAIDPEMATLLTALFGVVQVAIISGGAFPQFQTQVLAHLPQHDRFDKLSLLPTCGTRFYRYTDDWKLLYSEDLSDGQKQKIIAALHAAVDAAGFRPRKPGENLIEDRESQITYSALGQAAPLDEKKKWDPDFAKRKKIKALLDVSLPDAVFVVRALWPAPPLTELPVSGRLEGYQSDLGAKVGGRVVWVAVREGADVREGQVLVRLDDAQARAQSAAAAAAVQWPPKTVRARRKRRSPCWRVKSTKPRSAANKRQPTRAAA
jgi:hypothetical protein